MPLNCNYAGCDGAATLDKDAEQSDSAEQWECEHGHKFTVPLP
jgi:hypothetical protein